jgi:hypothetical protein
MILNHRRIFCFKIIFKYIPVSHHLHKFPRNSSLKLSLLQRPPPPKSCLQPFFRVDVRLSNVSASRTVPLAMRLVRTFLQMRFAQGFDLGDVAAAYADVRLFALI